MVPTLSLSNSFFYFSLKLASQCSDLLQWTDYWCCETWLFSASVFTSVLTGLSLQLIENQFKALTIP